MREVGVDEDQSGAGIDQVGGDRLVADVEKVTRNPKPFGLKLPGMGVKPFGFLNCRRLVGQGLILGKMKSE